MADAVVLRPRGPAGEAIAVLAVDELVVRQSFLVQRGTLLVQLRLGAVAAGLLLGDPGAALGFVGPLLANLGLLAVLGGDLLATMVELALLAL